MEDHDRPVDITFGTETASTRICLSDAEAVELYAGLGLAIEYREEQRQQVEQAAAHAERPAC